MVGWNGECKPAIKFVGIEKRFSLRQLPVSPNSENSFRPVMKLLFTFGLIRFFSHSLDEADAAFQVTEIFFYYRKYRQVVLSHWHSYQKQKSAPSPVASHELLQQC